jgi:hypothetical protein
MGMLAVGNPSAHPQKAAENVMEAARPRDSSAAGQERTAELFSKMSVYHRWQADHLERVSAVRTYEVHNEKGEVVAQEVVLMEYQAPATETFVRTSATGSGLVRQRVFRQLMKDEQTRLRAKKDAEGLITPENYTFELVALDRIGNSECTVVHAIPKRKETDLFDGTIWIDTQDFAIVKITGHLAKNPSFWVKRVDFERSYQKIDGFWVVSRETAVSAVRIFGRETLTVDYQNYAVNESSAFR